MALPARYIIVCEGKSEWTYVQSLNRLFRELPTEAVDGIVPLVLVPKPPPDGVGSGRFPRLVRELRRARRDNLRRHWPEAKSLFAASLPGRIAGQLFPDFLLNQIDMAFPAVFRQQFTAALHPAGARLQSPPASS